MSTFQAWINPLAFVEVDPPWSPDNAPLPSYDDVLKYLCSPDQGYDLTSLVQRYKRISVERQRLFAAPAEANILEKLVWPLKHAKASYMLSNFLGTIALCGMVAEMVTILLFDISNVQINGLPMDDEKQRALFGSTFERLGQERRVSVLMSYGLIDDQTKARFDIVREKRRRYLHFFSQEHRDLADDAVTVFDSTVALVVTAIGQGLSEGRVVLNHAMMKYLESRGVVQQQQSGTTGSGEPPQE